MKLTITEEFDARYQIIYQCFSLTNDNLIYHTNQIQNAKDTNIISTSITVGDSVTSTGLEACD